MSDITHEKVRARPIGPRLVVLFFVAVAAFPFVVFLSSSEPEITLARWAVRCPSPTDALARFAVYDGAERLLMDPLVLGCGDMVPAVTQFVLKKDSPRRVYALAFLGQTRDPRSADAASKIAEDPADAPAVRAAALETLDSVEHGKAVTVATTIVKVEGAGAQDAPEAKWLMAVARRVLDGKTIRHERRTWMAAFLGSNE
jgi:hypothetical protein